MIFLRREKGMTLIELSIIFFLIAVFATMGIASFSQVSKTIRDEQARSGTYKITRDTLFEISSALRQASPKVGEVVCFIGQNKSFTDSEGVTFDADRLIFSAFVPELTSKGRSVLVREYSVRTQAQQFPLRLARLEERVNLTGDPEEVGDLFGYVEEVKGLNFQYWDDEKSPPGWVDEWNSKGSSESKLIRMPKAVKITIDVVQEGRARPKSFRTVVALPMAR